MKSCIQFLILLKPILRHVAPEREAAPSLKARVVAGGSWVGGGAIASVQAGKLAAHPRVEREHIVAADELQKIFGGVVADAFDALHGAVEFGRGQGAPKHAFGVKVAL